jgi:diacylglycerol kinase family enzyme
VVDDGLHAGALSRWELVRNLLRLNTGRLPRHPLLGRGRCRSVRVESALPLALHLDGELFPPLVQPVRALEVTLLPGALRTMVHVGRRAVVP